MRVRADNRLDRRRGFASKSAGITSDQRSDQSDTSQLRAGPWQGPGVPQPAGGRTEIPAKRAAPVFPSELRLFISY